MDIERGVPISGSKGLFRVRNGPTRTGRSDRGESADGWAGMCHKRSLGWGRLCYQFMEHLSVSGAYSRSQQERSLPIVGIPLDSGWSPDRRAHSTQSMDPPSFGSHGTRRSPRRSTADKGTRYDRKQTETRFAWQACRGVKTQRQQQDALLASELLVLAAVIVIF